MKILLLLPLLLGFSVPAIAHNEFNGGEVGISPGGVTPSAGDLQSGDSQNNPLIHVKGNGVSGTGGEGSDIKNSPVARTGGK